MPIRLRCSDLGWLTRHPHRCGSKKLACFPAALAFAKAQPDEACFAVHFAYQLEIVMILLGCASTIE
jgi:hypothetical protein